ncbi:uncharacterized protein sha isoform X1 [Tribolium castaneum]|uniref:Shavenoid isoform B-like N-terminal domain-containing protein n=2 Tax=Tribolium castaneum TaxID=7070 RepID=A0A139WE28_TRICA|nr:PREDICTED: uncharacterized protein LOC655137 isoform X1 [Tribolium castaneum]KYB26200.1 hypothetical protein TcasGA2_TC033884 [Tribolium castaneum]|eukprot:XP_966739.2 PREDICTED: uncharacterized protein LOC655137 isoform X1 [Tribolium castaneum]
MEVAGLLFLMLPCLAYAMGGMTDVSLRITRQNKGDVFTPEDVKSCTPETCVGLSSGTASAPSYSDPCTCQCHPHLPAFREDLRICVDDIHECMLAPFVGGSTSETIPFVFLPLKGQIIHPSKEISFSGVQTPICAVSGAKFLTESGWVDLRNPVDTDVPFRLFRDEGRTFLQWVGEADLRSKMSGRLVLVYLMCRELATNEPLTPTGYTLFSPCVAFRVVGSPTKFLSNVSEVAFSTDAHSSSENSNRLSVSEYVAIGTCSVLLGLIYVASVFLYVHLKKRNKDTSRKSEDKNLTSAEEGVVKNNPLLNMTGHFQPDTIYTDSTSSDPEADLVQHSDDKKTKLGHTTSALVHSQYQHTFGLPPSVYLDSNHQDPSSIEKLPEENVSIVETLEGRDDRIDSFKALTGTVRRKLYFNPAYFEPQLLLTPPPAALEFLAKIREVITIAKQKMAAKKFSPSLIVIPEEDNSHTESPYDNPKPSMSRRSSMISLKRENSRRKTCTGCPGCEPQDFTQLCGKLPEFPSLGACKTCSSTDSKQRSIRKWLEDVPVLKQSEEAFGRTPKRLRSPTRSLPDGAATPSRALSPRPASERATSPEKNHRRVFKPKAPPPPPPEHQYDSVPVEKREMSFPPPDMIHEAMVVDQEEIRIPTLTKKHMRAVIEELAIQRGMVDSSPETAKRGINYETDSLERNRGYSTPTEYADLSSSQPSPSLSTALPMDEEMTMRNAIFNKKTGNMTISKINVDCLHEDEHDYELIVLKKGTLQKQNFYKLPELLQRSNGYSLVSEVYVNNGYNYSSAPSSSSDSNCSTFDRRTLKVRYEDGVEKPGKLLIEVKDCADHYIPVHDSDSFEPDTLDRKPSKLKLTPRFEDEFIDSLERPSRILLRSNGSFKNIPSSPIHNTSNFNRVFGSLREIYEAKTRGFKPPPSSYSDNGIEGRILSLEERHSKRQRRLTTLGNIPPDLIPPPPHGDSPIYEHPKPPRKVHPDDEEILVKPPLPPKNVIGRGVSRNTGGKVGTPERWTKQEDPGYLSDSSSPKLKSESDESVDEGHSESGAESVETHSVFFGSFRKPNFLAFGSMDSGVDSMKESLQINKILVVNEKSFS